MIYLDAASAPPFHQRFLQYFNAYILAHPNPFHAKSLHEGGRSLRALLNEAEDALLEAFFSHPITTTPLPKIAYKVQFFSSGSEALREAVKGVEPEEWIRTKGEHSALRSLVRVKSTGENSDDKANKGIQKRLRSCIYGQNETGQLEPQDYLTSHIQNQNLLTDCIASWGKVELQPMIEATLKGSENAFFVIQAGKIGGFPGSGALIYPASLSHLFKGNQQSHYLTALCFLYFSKHLKESISTYQTHVKECRDFFEQEIKKTPLVSQILFTHEVERFKDRLPHVSHFKVIGSEPLHLVQKLDLKGFCVSSGSACSSLSPEPSPILLEMGWSKIDALNAIRVSLSKENTKKELSAFIETLSTLRTP